MKTVPASKKDIWDATDDTLNVLDALMARVDNRFENNEQRIIKLQKDITFLSCQLDAVHKSMELSNDERLVIAYQLTKIHAWVEAAAKRIGLDFMH